MLSTLCLAHDCLQLSQHSGTSLALCTADGALYHAALISGLVCVGPAASQLQMVLASKGLACLV
jgi:hypothetical protein